MSCAAASTRQGWLSPPTREGSCGWRHPRAASQPTGWIGSAPRLPGVAEPAGLEKSIPSVWALPLQQERAAVVAATRSGMIGGPPLTSMPQFLSLALLLGYLLALIGASLGCARLLSF